MLYFTHFSRKWCNFAAENCYLYMEKMQFTAIVLMTLLTLKLLLLPAKVSGNPVMNRSRWLMVCSTAMLVVQFLLQYKYGLRAMGVTQAVMVNLAMFVPASWLLSLSILHLQRQGRVTRVDWWFGGVTWLVVLAIIGVAAATDGQPLLSDTPKLHNAEIIASFFFAGMLGYYVWRHLTNLRAMYKDMDNYYDMDMGGLLQWMRLSVIVLPVMGLMVPLLIFFDSPWLAFIGLLFFGGIFYLVDSFCSYVVSSAPAKVVEAEKSEESAELGGERQGPESFDGSSMGYVMDTMKWVDMAVERWKNSGGFLEGGLTLPHAANAIGVSKYHLSCWLRQNNLRYNDWITDLRIAEAKHMICNHPEWNNDAVAQHCGFADRSYFQRKFKEKTGLSPVEYFEVNRY